MARYINPETKEIVDVSPEQGEALGFILVPEFTPIELDPSLPPRGLIDNLLGPVPALAEAGGAVEKKFKSEDPGFVGKALGKVAELPYPLGGGFAEGGGSAAVGSLVKDLSELLSPADIATLGAYAGAGGLAKVGAKVAGSKLAKVARLLDIGTSGAVAGVGTAEVAKGIEEGDWQETGKGALFALLGALGLRGGLRGGADELMRVDAPKGIVSELAPVPKPPEPTLPQDIRDLEGRTIGIRGGMDVPPVIEPKIEPKIPAEITPPIEVSKEAVTEELPPRGLDRRQKTIQLPGDDRRYTIRREGDKQWLEEVETPQQDLENYEARRAFEENTGKPLHEEVFTNEEQGLNNQQFIERTLTGEKPVASSATLPKSAEVNPRGTPEPYGLGEGGVAYTYSGLPKGFRVFDSGTGESNSFGVLNEKGELVRNTSAKSEAEAIRKYRKYETIKAEDKFGFQRNEEELKSVSALEPEGLKPVSSLEKPKSAELSDTELESSIAEIEAILKKRPDDPLIAKTLEPVLNELKVERTNRNISISAGGKKVITFKDWYENVKKEKFEGYKDVDAGVKKELQGEYEAWKAGKTVAPSENVVDENVTPDETIPPENATPPPEPPSGTVPPGNGGNVPKTPSEDPVKKLVRIINETARPARKEQELLQHARNAEVAEKLKGKEVRGLEGEEWYKQSLEAMKGKTQKADFSPVRDKFTDDDVKSLFNIIKNRQKLDIYDQVHAGSGLSKLLQGEIPQGHELKILDATFGEELVKALLEKRSTLQKTGEIFVNVASIPRAMASSFDLSAPLRQGLVLGISHPKAAYAAGRDMFKALKGKGTFEALQEAINSSPNKELRKEAGLYLADKHAYQHGSISAGEEAFMSNFAEKYIPGVERSEMAYIAYLNKLRSDVFDSYVKDIVNGGTKLDSPEGMKALKDTAWFINNATGRGSLGKLERISGLLNVAIFSPRFQTSRLALMNPKSYVNLSPTVRKKAIGDMVKAYGTVAATLSLLALSKDVKVEVDPRSSDFGKVHVGKARLDLLGGMQPWMRFMAQEAKSERKTASGKIEKFGSGPYAPTSLSTAGKMLRSKLAPFPALIADLKEGTQISGDPTTLESSMAKFAPMFLQDLNEVLDITPLRRKGLDFSYDPKFGTVKAPEGLAMVPPAFFGGGLQVYDSKKKGLKPVRPLTRR